MDDFVKLELSARNPLHGRILHWVQAHRAKFPHRRTLHQHVIAALNLYFDVWEGRVQVVNRDGVPVASNVPSIPRDEYDQLAGRE